jgi:hypothetical protein
VLRTLINEIPAEMGKNDDPELRRHLSARALSEGTPVCYGE